MKWREYFFSKIQSMCRKTYHCRHPFNLVIIVPTKLALHPYFSNIRSTEKTGPLASHQFHFFDRYTLN